ncbi:DsbC family protein [Marinobacterium sediminicola]|uniref:Thiol:disulfide interchange protein n=1 Tax=Marinobacterium sediminicola TaxID=518898 RepID=A0ABY1S0U0_9GAMM|nr:DsbC family protein [Marinobacterium sediminicola]ULG69600.1 DsbC family protein [Marinobacterium sediminicola]SMR74672.1 thiol:disulfide interchange protein DsbC [Marinobacterium sediminicola]
MRSTTLTSAMMLVLTGSVWAAESAEENIRQQLSQVDSRLQVQSVQPAPVAGLYEVMLSSGETLYADMKGEYLLAGQLFKVDQEQGLVNLTEQKRNLARLEAMQALDEADMVVYKPTGEVKATLHVFTDVDCPYCRKLHEEVPALNKMGVQVNYLAFPRGGPGSPAHLKMQTIWCGTEAQRRERMDAIKGGERLDNESCENPVLDQYVLGQTLGVTGTPALITDDGTLLPGYMPAARLQQILKLN